MDVSQYLEIFLDETKEHLQSLNTQLLDLEQNPDHMDTINEIFRAAHSLKGMAGTMGYKRMQALTHDMENVFSDVRTGEIKVTAEMVDLLFQCLDALEEYLTQIQTTADEGTNDNMPLIKALQQFLEKNEASAGLRAEYKEKLSAQESIDGLTEALWKSIVFDEQSKSHLEEVVKEGKNIYGIDVFIQETCILKAARAFLVFKALEEIGEIVISNPSTQDIEDEHFDLSFAMIVATDETIDRVLEAVDSVSEIENVTGAIYMASDMLEENTEDSEIEEEFKGENMAETKPAVIQTTAPVQQKSKASKAAEKKMANNKPIVNRTVRVDIEKLDVLMNLVSELITAKNSIISASVTTESTTSSALNEQIEYLETVTTNLHESVMKVRMVPIESVVTKFPRMIRDLSKKLDKKLELYMSGEETELDRTVVDEIGDPLMHLLRNSADHGIESAQVRRERGKPEVGSIFLEAYQDGNNVIIEVRDDGNGIDVESVKEKAIERGVITADQAENMSDKDITDLLFLPSFSMAKKVSDVSGRGVGLDVVKSKIESLSGDVEVKSKLGKGSTWIIRLPLTLAIIQALMVKVGEEKYAISLGAITTIEDIMPKDIKLVQSKEVIHLRGTVIPLIRLDKVLDIDIKDDNNQDLIVVIVKKGEKLAGLVVDELIGQQEIVIKSLGKYISKCKVISGATILGDGGLALILDANALI